MELRLRWARGRRLIVALAVLACAAACGSGPNIAPPRDQEQLLGTPDRIAAAPELITAIEEHLDRARTARVESSSKSLPDDGRPAIHGLAVVRFRPGYATDTTFDPLVATGPAGRSVEVDGARYDTVIGDAAPAPWRKTVLASDSVPTGSWLIPTDLGEIDEVIEGERILGQPVIGYRFYSEGLSEGSNFGHSTFYMNAKKQLVRYHSKINGLVERTETYYDFGVPADIGPPPADQVAPT